MANLQSARRGLSAAAIILAVVDMAMALFLFSPWSRTRAAAETDYERTRQELRVRADQVAPLRGMDKKLVEAQGEINDFFKQRFAAEGSAITAELGKQAAENRVRISQGRYDVAETELPGLRRVRIEALLDGDYVQTVKFINALERDRMFFIINSVTLGEQQGGKVRLNLKLETYLKEQG